MSSARRAIAIENKPFAADQVDQIRDYHDHLERTYPDGHHLVYLSAVGSDPSGASIGKNEAERRTASGELIVIGYGDLLPWLEACKHASGSDRVGSFIAELQRFIERRFQGVTDLKADETILDDITGSPDRIASAIQLISSGERLRSKLVDMLETQLRAAAMTRGWLLAPPLADGYVRWSGFEIRFGEGDEVRFRFEFNDNRRMASYFGMKGLGPAHGDYDPIKTALFETIGRGTATRVWPWMRDAASDDPVLPLASNWYSDPEPWISVGDGTLAPKLIAAAQIFYDVLHPLGFVGKAKLT